MSGVPKGPRVLAGLGALATGLYFGAALPASLLARGYTLTGYVLLACTLPLVAFLVALALFPDALQRTLTRFTRIDLRDGGHVAAAVVMAGTLFFVLGYGSLVNGAYAYESQALGQDEPISGDALFQGLILNVVVLVIPPIFYVAFVGEGGPRRALASLGIREEGAGRAIGVGVATAVGVLILIAIAGALLQGSGIELPENERALEIARSVTILGAIGLAVGSSVSEEVFFRGFLQPRVGMLGQAIFFALAHLSYVNALEIGVTFILALLFGLAYRATGSLLAPIAGHFTFNLLMLLAGIYAPESGSG